MRRIVVALCLVLAPIGALAWPGSPGIYGFPILNCAAHAVDNGCSGGQPRTLGFLPAWQDKNYAYDSAQSGQLTSSSTPTDIANRLAAFHYNDNNIPFIDYPIGSAAPATLAPISGYVDATGICVYTASGYTYGNGPYIICRDTRSSIGSETRTIQGYDFSNCGSGTNTCFVGFLGSVQGTGTNLTIQFINDYWTCSAVNSCPNDSPYLIRFPAAGSGPPVVNIVFNHITYEANYVSGGSVANTSFIDDSRSGTTFPFNWPIKMTYSYISNLGGDPITGTASGGGDSEIDYSVCDGCGINGSVHGEWEERTAARTTRNFVGKGDVWLTPAAHYFIDLTTPFYMTSGDSNNTIVSSIDLEYNLSIVNKSSCANSPSGSGRQYGPLNPCSGGTAYANSSLFSVNYDSSVTGITLTGNVMDNTGATGCYSNEANPPLVDGPTSTVSGTTFTVNKSSETLFGGHDFAFFPGMNIKDNTGGTTFVPTTIVSYGTLSPYATFIGSTNSSSTSFSTTLTNALLVGNVVEHTTSNGTVTSQLGTIATWGTNSGTFTGNASATVTNDYMASLNNTTGAIPGQNPYVGTVTLGTSETGQSGGSWLTWAATAAPTASNNYKMSGTSTSLTAVTFSSLSGPTSPSSCN